jgi:hypothetical protein
VRKQLLSTVIGEVKPIPQKCAFGWLRGTASTPAVLPYNMPNILCLKRRREKSDRSQLTPSSTRP